MTPPASDGHVPDSEPQMNTEPFNSTNPFADAEPGASGQNRQSTDNAEPGENTYSAESNDSADSASTDGKQSEAESLDKAQSRSKSIEKTESGSGDETLMDKIRTAADEATPAVVEKIKTAAAKKFHLSSIRATGPVQNFNPTTVRAHIRFKDDLDGGEEKEGLTKPESLEMLWRSRDNRKGRNSVIVPRRTLKDPSLPKRPWYKPEFVSSFKEVGQNIWKMFTTFPYWDMAFWSGWSYTIGSILFVIDGAFAFSLEAFPDSEFDGEDPYGIPLCFFIGALFYQVGAVMAYLEAVNDGSFHGSAMRRLLEGHEEDQKKLLDEKIHRFFHHCIPHLHRHKKEDEEDAKAATVDPEAGWRTKESRDERPGSIYPEGKAPPERRGCVDYGEAEEGDISTYKTWRWYPSWHALRTHHVYEIGYLACTIQLFGVTLYGVTAIVVFPGILDTLEPWQELGAYWVPQIVAAACFLIASIMFMLETQEKWWKPELKTLGWWIGFWSVVGSVGFELCASFGLPSADLSWAAYQSELSTTWGSFAYLVGSFLQWYEAVNKRPFQEILNEPGPMKSYQVHPI